MGWVIPTPQYMCWLHEVHLLTSLYSSHVVKYREPRVLLGTSGLAGVPKVVCAAASWLQAAYHTITAVVGAGVLGLPHAFSFLGWGAGIVVLAAAGLSALFTARLLATMHESNGVRHNR